MESEHFDCPICLLKFNRGENIPKIVPCGHTICSLCMGTIFAAKKERFCPLDRKSLDAEITVETLPTNIILLQLLEEKPISEFELCPSHKEPAKMVCMTDKCVVCKYCTKYSDAHKDHKLVHYNDVKQKVSSKKQSLTQQLKGLDEKSRDAKDLLIENRKQLKLQIEQKYNDIQRLLIQKMKKTLKQVDTFFDAEQSYVEEKAQKSSLLKDEIRKNLTLLNNSKNMTREILEILSEEENQKSGEIDDDFKTYEDLLQSTVKKVKTELDDLQQHAVKSGENLYSMFLTDKSFNYTVENSPNLFFYQNKLEAKPTNIFLKEFLESWSGEFDKFEASQGSTTQWLYPNFFRSRVNPHSKELAKHEAEFFRNDISVAENLVEAYKFVLDFFGMKMIDDQTGDLARTGKWALRYPHTFLIQTSNFLLMRRVLAFLNNTGFRRYALKLVDMLEKEIYGEIGGYQKFLQKDINKALFDKAPLKDLARENTFKIFAMYGDHQNDPKKIKLLEENCFSMYPEGFVDSVFFDIPKKL